MIEILIPNSTLPPIVVEYDMDDIMWDLCGFIGRNLGLDMRNWIDFHIQEIPYFTDEQKKSILEAFGDVETFKQLKFYPDVDRILRVRKFGAEVRVKSSSGNQDIIDYKIWALKRAVPGITEDDMELNLIQLGETVHKHYESTTLIAIDDNSYNIAVSDAKWNIMPSWQPWSVSPKALQTVANRQVLWLPSLKAINDCVYRQVKILSALSDQRHV